MSDLIQRKNKFRYSALKKGDENNVSSPLKTNNLKLSPYSKSRSSNWKTNNVHLARENARLKKDIQKCVTALNESSVRYENLEMAWRRREETLSKIDIISRLVGNQISKLVDTLTELRTACQVELATSFHETLTESLEQTSRLRHSMPIRTNKSTLQMHSRSQLINHVNPMVSGHPIIKPTITLQRLNLRNVPLNVPGEQVQVQSRVLNEVEIPLERLSLSQIAESIGSPVNRNSLSPLEAQEDSSIFGSTEMPSRISMDTILEESPETCPRNSIPARGSPRTSTTLVDSPNSNWAGISFDERSSVSNRHSNNTRKYPSTSRARTPTSAEQRNRMNADIEKCCLVVALKDVGSYLRNGTLTNVELLEERKVKTGASAHPDLKVGNSNVNDDPQLNISSASGEDHTEVDFTTEIETMDYGSIPLNNDNEKENSFSATQEFLNRIKNEDPLEGPSWRYENVTTRQVRKRHRPQSFSISPSAKKNKQDDVFPSIDSPKKANSLGSSKLCEPTNGHLHLEPESSFSNAYLDKAELDITECMVPCGARLEPAPNISIKEEQTKFYFSDVPIVPRDSLESSQGISSSVLEKEVNLGTVNLSPVKTECNLEFEANCNPNRPRRSSNRSNSQSTNLDQHKSSSRKQKKEQKKKNVSKPHSEKGKEKKKSKNRLIKQCKKDVKTESEALGDHVLEMRRTGSLCEERPRVRRAVAPKCLKEPLLNSKLRQE